MSLATITDRIHQRLEAENTDRGTYTQLANELESAAAAEKDYGRAGKLRSMASGLRKISQQEEDHLKALTKIYQDLGNLQKQKSSAMAEAGQLLKGAEQAGGAAARLAGRGLSYVGQKLSSLETEGGSMRLPIVSYNDVVNGLQMPGEPRKTFSANITRGDYYLDERMRQLRSVALSPTLQLPTVIQLNEFEVEYFRQRAH